MFKLSPYQKIVSWNAQDKLIKMAKPRTRIINLYITPGKLASIFKILTRDKSEYDFSGINELRQLLTNEKAKLLNVIKAKSPESIYHLAKIVGRDFKAVREDIKLLEKMGMIELKAEAKGKRKKLKPVVIVDNLQVNISFE